MRRLFLLLALLPTVGAAQTAPPTLDTYQTWLRTAYAAATRADRIGLDDVAQDLFAATTVQLPNGSTAPVDHTWLRDALQQEPPDYDLITGRIGALLDAMNQQPGAVPAADAEQQLNDIFNRPPFRTATTPSFITRIFDAIGEALTRFLEWLFGRVQPNTTVPTPFAGVSALGWLLLFLGLLLVVGLLVYALRGVRHSVRGERAARQAAEEAQLSSGDALLRAQDLIRSGDTRSAVRYLYLSSLLWLDERKLLRYDRTRTNREYLAEVRNNPRLHERLDPVVTTFDRVWYGKRALDEDGLRRYQEQVDALRREEPPQ